MLFYNSKMLQYNYLILAFSQNVRFRNRDLVFIVDTVIIYSTMIAKNNRYQLIFECALFKKTNKKNNL